MKKLAILILSACLCISISACTSTEEAAPENVVFSVADYPVQVTCPQGWWQKEESNFDLQCKSKDSSINMSIFCYYDIDLSDGMTRQDFFESQNQSVMDMRENASIVEEMNSTQYEDKEIVSILYSAEYEAGKNYYYMNLVSFTDSDCFAWVLFSGMPSEVNANRDTIDNILDLVSLTEQS